MSASTFNPHSFLMKISPDLLEQYAKKQGISFQTKIKEAGEELTEEFLTALEKEPESKQDGFWLDSHEYNVNF
ncbi:hypothetical protein JKY72_01180 [Candidatus Gracilibacteria bacterium]|nr:hypothetical protein [Candidatus Gracilibacteria bacterium]